MSRLSELPWDSMRRAFRHIRKLFFTRERADTPTYVVDATLEEVREELGMLSFAPNWEFSYNYRGEDINLARVEYQKSKRHPEIVWWQVHVRGWMTDRGIELQAHWEGEPTENDSSHLNGDGLSRTVGTKRLGEYLDETGLNVVKDPRENYHESPSKK